MGHSKSYGFKIHGLKKSSRYLATISAQAEIVELAKQHAPDTPLSIVTRRIIDAGYLDNMRAIAAGRNLGRITPALASAIVCESTGTHQHWHVCQCDRPEMQAHAARLLKAAFGVEVPA